MSIQQNNTVQSEPTTTPADVAAPSQREAAKPARKKPKINKFALMLALPIVLALVGTYVYFTGGRYEETENANLLLAKISIASEIPGRVTVSNVANDKHVSKGDILFQVDPEPYRIALVQADAAVASARLAVTQLRAAYEQTLAAGKAAESDVSYTQDSLKRYETLAKKGVATAANLDDARHAAQKAEDALSSARQAIANAKAALGPALDGQIDDHPSVQAALAKRDQAAYNLKVATVYAPADGILYEASNFRAGEYVSPGASLFTLVETEAPWIQANFKETQLTHIQKGQSAEVTFDVMPDRHFKATVESIGAGTGAEFSLLPAQNATGNWVKVTQRVPVKLTLDNKDANLLLRSGLSASVTVDTKYSRHVADLFTQAHAAE